MRSVLTSISKTMGPILGPLAGPLAKVGKVAGDALPVVGGLAVGGVGPALVGAAVQEVVRPTGLVDDMLQLGRDLIPFEVGAAAPAETNA